MFNLLLQIILVISIIKLTANAILVTAMFRLGGNIMRSDIKKDLQFREDAAGIKN